MSKDIFIAVLFSFVFLLLGLVLAKLILTTDLAYLFYL